MQNFEYPVFGNQETSWNSYSPQQARFPLPQQSYTSTPISMAANYDYYESSSSFSTTGEFNSDLEEAPEPRSESSCSSISENHSAQTVPQTQTYRSDSYQNISMTMAELQYKKLKNVPVMYYKNMARSFPSATPRTPEEQLQRQKNTEAARHSRAKAKIIEGMVEQEHREAANENVNGKRMVATQRCYANLLLKVLMKDEVDWAQRWRLMQDDKNAH